MIKTAILFTKDNAALISAELIDYKNPIDLLAEYEYMFANHDVLVLGKDQVRSGESVLSYVVTESMFKANNPDVELNDKTFTEIARF